MLYAQRVFFIAPRWLHIDRAQQDHGEQHLPSRCDVLIGHLRHRREAVQRGFQ
jgi:hypothetical protein